MMIHGSPGNGAAFFVHKAEKLIMYTMLIDIFSILLYNVYI